MYNIRVITGLLFANRAHDSFINQIVREYFLP